jgi:hypothetical protein
MAVAIPAFPAVPAILGTITSSTVFSLAAGASVVYFSYKLSEVVADNLNKVIDVGMPIVAAVGAQRYNVPPLYSMSGALFMKTMTNYFKEVKMDECGVVA